jgi:hypothetical protein
MIFAAFDPAPEAKIAILVMTKTNGNIQGFLSDNQMTNGLERVRKNTGNPLKPKPVLT